jgi:putative iron-dependent peroxidase
MGKPQSAILQPVPVLARYANFSCTNREQAHTALKSLVNFYPEHDMVVGIGHSLATLLDVPIPGLEPFPAMENADITIPANATDIWCWLRGDDRGVLYHHTRELEGVLENAFQMKKVIDAFRYLDGHDLSGYEDGTENPEADAAFDAAIVNTNNDALDGSSYVAVQQWVHNMDTLEAMSREQQDNIIGRRLSDNEEIDDAPDSAHVKRTAQEDFDPEAFVVRRSMPWTDETRAGLNFVAFGNSFYAFEAQMKRMIGMDDGIVDGLFQFSRPISSSYYWCPPVTEGRLDLKLLGI